MPDIKEIVASSILTPQKVGSLSSYYDYSLNPYSGCAFSCSYCYVPKFPNARHEYTEWGKWVEVKINAPQLIQRDRLKIFGARIFFSSATDPYQYIELKYRLTRRCLEQLLKYKPGHLTMHTRSHLILQDIDLIKEFGSDVSVGVSLTTDDEAVRREFEPKAPSVERRLELIKALRASGIDVYISMAPLLPCNAERFVGLIAPYVDRVWIDNMRWVEVNTKPELIEKYAAHFEPDNHAMLSRKLEQLFTAERARCTATTLDGASSTTKSRRRSATKTYSSVAKKTAATASFSRQQPSSRQLTLKLFD